jgi:hypothetical protein
MTPSSRGLPRRPGLPQVSGVLADTPATLPVAADCTSDRGLSAAGVLLSGGGRSGCRRFILSDNWNAVIQDGAEGGQEPFTFIGCPPVLC